MDSTKGILGMWLQNFASAAGQPILCRSLHLPYVGISFFSSCRFVVMILISFYACLTFLLIFDNPLFSTLTHYPSYFARGSTVPSITDFGWNCCTLRMKHLSKRFHTFENTIFLAQLSSSRLLMPRGHAWTIATTFGASWKSWPTKATKNGFFH